MNSPHFQGNLLAHTPRRVPLRLHFLCALLLSVPAQAIDIRIDPPPSPDKAIRGLRGFIHRVFNDSRDVRSSRRSSTSQQVARTPELSARSRPIAAYRPQEEAVTLEEARPLPQKSKSVVPTKPSDRTSEEQSAATPTTETEAAIDSTSLDAQHQISTAPAAAPPPAQTVAFARPVPGKKGIVYPPGAEESPDTEVDVSELQPGQLARDPRSGRIFRVP